MDLKTIILQGILLFGSMVAVAKSSTSLDARTTNSNLRKFCLLLALPGRENGQDFDKFEEIFNAQLNEVGTEIFGNSDHDNRMKLSEKDCKDNNSFIPKCTYYRIAIIRNHLINDMRTLKVHLGQSFQNAEVLYINLLSTWYMDKVFLNLECGPLDITFQWKYIAIWSNLLESRLEFCTWSKPLHKTVARNLRKEVKTICEHDKTETICQLQQIFDFVDSVDQMCNFVPSSNWTTDSGSFKYYKNAVRIYLFFMRQQKKTGDVYDIYEKTLTEEAVRNDILNIISKLFQDFRANDLSLTRNLLKVLPKTMYIQCEYSSPFPTFKWLVCAASKVFEELRVYVETYVEKNINNRRQKVLPSNIDIRDYIKNLKTSQILQLTQKNTVDLQVVARTIQNNIQDRFKQLGTYFEQVAEYQQSKLNADVMYLKGRIEMYSKRFDDNIKELQSSIKTLLENYNRVAVADVAQAGVKMTIRIAKAGNPFKWLTDSGNSDDILESATEIAVASRLLTETIQSSEGFDKLLEFSKEIALKLKNNEAMLKVVKDIIDNATCIVEVVGQGFEAQQSQFLEDYNNYSPQVTKDDLAKLDSYWGLFIDGICDGIESSESIIAQSIRGFEETKRKCREAKTIASKLIETQMEIYDLQFELMETMANLMGSLTQIQSSKIIGKGPRVQNPANLSTENIEMLMAVFSMSYNIFQTTNIQKLCNIMEYRHGQRPSLCNGLATNLDKLLALSDPICYTEFKYMTVSTKNPNKRDDFSWLDMQKLYRGESVSFQVPNSKWWMDHSRISASERNQSFFLSALEVYMPTTSKTTRGVRVYVTPTNIDNKLRDDSNTSYVITPLDDIISVLKSSYEEGQNGRCRLQNMKISNPYFHCGPNTRPLFKDLCPTKLQSDIPGMLLPSIYSKFKLRIEGYENLNLSNPVTDMDVVIGVKYCAINPSGNSIQRKKRHTLRTKRGSGNSKCCSQDKQYFSEKTQKCEACPTGTKSYYNSLFCGQLIDIRYPDNLSEAITYEQAVSLCQKYGSSIASLQLFQEAKTLGQKSCVCGWIEGSKVDSITARSTCTSKSTCIESGTRSVHCKTVFTT